MRSSGTVYWCCIVTKDGTDTLERTIGSIFAQSAPPEFVAVVDDGSTDNTQALLKGLSLRYQNLFVLRNPSQKRDIRRVPALLNMGAAYCESVRANIPPLVYMMVAGDDVELAPNYASLILERMGEDPRIAVASGSWHRSGRLSGRMPHGAGRIIRADFLERVGSRYPVAYGWEAWLIYKAMQLGYKVRNFPDARFEHLRRYNPTNLMGWGRGMYSLGFPSYFVFLRLLINLVWVERGTQSRKGGIGIAAGFLSTKLNPGPVRSLLVEDEALRSFVRRYSATRLAKASL